MRESESGREKERGRVVGLGEFGRWEYGVWVRAGFYPGGVGTWEHGQHAGYTTSTAHCGFGLAIMIGTD